MCVVPIFPRVIYCTTQEQFFSVEQRVPTETRVCNVHHKFPIFGSGLKTSKRNTKTGEFMYTCIVWWCNLKLYGTGLRTKGHRRPTAELVSWF